MDNKRSHKQSIDGFALRRRTPQTGGERPLASDNMQVPDRFLHDGALPKPVAQAPAEPTARSLLNADAAPMESPKKQDVSATGLRRADIDASLSSIDEPPKGKRPKRHARRWRPSKKFFKRLAIVLLVLILLTGLYVGIKAFIASGKVFKGNIFDLLGQGQQLKTDQYGRSNILVFGTSEDDPGHQGGDLTDSIMIISVDQKAKNAAMISVPRDLWVKYGKACASGYEGRINVVYSCNSNQGADQEAGANALKSLVGENFGVDIQYYIHANYTAVRGVVNAVGGVDIVIESRDPRGQMDSNFDWKCKGGNQWASRATMIKNCPPNGHFIDYPNGPVHLDAEHALYLAQARGDAAPTYGFEQSNFDREKNQQKIIKAIKDKATSIGTLSNPAAVTGIIDTLGDNVRTNFTGAEIKTLITLGKDISNNNIKSISLVDQNNAVVGTGMVGDQSVVKPVAGTYDFTEIQSYVRGKLNAINGDEDANITVLNGSTKLGVAKTESDTLKTKGITVTTLGDTDANNYPEISWYDLSGGKLPKTSAKLKEALGVAAAGTTLPAGVQSSSDFVIIVGDGVN